jgi:hypothetical protein
MPRVDRALVGAQQPALEQAGHPVHPGHGHVGRARRARQDLAVVTYQTAANQVVSGVRVRSKTVPAVTDTRRAQPAHDHRASSRRQPCQLSQYGSRTPPATAVARGRRGKRRHRRTTPRTRPTCPGSPCPSRGLSRSPYPLHVESTALTWLPPSGCVKCAGSHEEDFGVSIQHIKTYVDGAR